MDMFEISSKNMTEKKEMSESDVPKTDTISDKGANISYEPGPEQRVTTETSPLEALQNEVRHANKRFASQIGTMVDRLNLLTDKVCASERTGIPRDQYCKPYTGINQQLAYNHRLPQELGHPQHLSSLVSAMNAPTNQWNEIITKYSEELRSSSPVELVSITLPVCDTPNNAVTLYLHYRGLADDEEYDYTAPTMVDMLRRIGNRLYSDLCGRSAYVEVMAFRVNASSGVIISRVL